MRKPVQLDSRITPRDYQQQFWDVALLLAKEQPHQPHLFVSPCGTGKSYMGLGLLERVPTAILHTPRVEIITGMLEKIGYNVDDWALPHITELAADHGIFTPIRLRNWLRDGKLPWYPDLIVVDECHHQSADTYQQIDMYLNGIPTIGLTATAYCGTPKATKELHGRFGDVINQVLSLQDSIERGYNTLPTASIWPLVDDDEINVVNGEISASSADLVIGCRLEAIAKRIQKSFWSSSRELFDRPTMVSLPTSNLIKAFKTVCDKMQLPCKTVSQDTSRRDRETAFVSTINRRSLLVQIDVVSEGVDLPLRRLIDAKPTMSPRRWMQQIGRIMRPTEPGELPPEYISVCRNLERHCYLMEGMFPTETILEAQEAFKVPTRRAGMRVIGLEELGKFTTTPVMMLNGVVVTTYNLVRVDEFQRTEYFAIVHPGHADPIIGERKIPLGPGGKPDWTKGRWQLVERIPDVKGCLTAKDWPLTEKQKARWARDAANRGLNPHQEVSNRSVQAMFFLADLHLRLT